MKRRSKRYSKSILILFTILTMVFNANLMISAEIEPSFDPKIAPENVSVELRNYPDGKPYFYLQWTNPQHLIDMVEYWDNNGEAPMEYQIDAKIGDGAWRSDAGLTVNGNSLHAGYDESDIHDMRFAHIDPESDAAWGTIDIKANVYSFRVFYKFVQPNDENEVAHYSAYSKIVSIGTAAFYQNASEWAKTELQQAADLSLIPDLLIGADMTKPITREEFCELALLLFEKTTATTVEPYAPNPFKDTVNPQVLKAFALGITKGTSDTTFEPNKTITRQECATMLFRALTKITPDADFSIAGVADFPDQKDIDSWAVEATKYMSKIGIIKGDTQGNFMPKATSPAQVAIGFGTASREAAIAMSVRIYNKQG